MFLSHRKSCCCRNGHEVRLECVNKKDFLTAASLYNQAQNSYLSYYGHTTHAPKKKMEGTCSRCHAAIKEEWAVDEFSDTIIGELRDQLWKREKVIRENNILLNAQQNEIDALLAKKRIKNAR